MLRLPRDTVDVGGGDLCATPRGGERGVANPRGDVEHPLAGVHVEDAAEQLRDEDMPAPDAAGVVADPRRPRVRRAVERSPGGREERGCDGDRSSWWAVAPQAAEEAGAGSGAVNGGGPSSSMCAERSATSRSSAKSAGRAAISSVVIGTPASR